MEKKLIHPNQIYYLKQILKDKFYIDHFKIYDLENMEGLSNMTEKQWKYFQVLLSKREWFKIKDLLDKFLTHK